MVRGREGRTYSESLIAYYAVQFSIFDGRGFVSCSLEKAQTRSEEMNDASRGVGKEASQSKSSGEEDEIHRPWDRDKLEKVWKREKSAKVKGRET